MAKCSYCGSIIVLGGIKHGNLRFCNKDCQQFGLIPSVLSQAPKEAVERYIQEVHTGLCPICGGPGPVDVYTSYSVWSFFVVTRTTVRNHICCRSCGKKKKLLDTLSSFFLGWWSIEGFVWTISSIFRNLSSLSKSPDPSNPSPQLIALLKAKMVSELLKKGKSINSEAG